MNTFIIQLCYVKKLPVYQICKYIFLNLNNILESYCPRRAQESDDDEDQMTSGPVAIPGSDESEDPGGIARELAARFHDLNTCSELVARYGAALQRSLVDLEIPPTDTTKQVSERATLFRISCNAMMNVISFQCIVIGLHFKLF